VVRLAIFWIQFAYLIFIPVEFDLASVLNDCNLDADFKPDKYLHIFLNHPTKLIEFLEFVINESKSITDADGKGLEVSFEISNTLLEMYLHSYKNEIKEDVSLLTTFSKVALD